jgi:murein DD-endopeptidase MepM/ murein hydrolase activator NlpD
MTGNDERWTFLLLRKEGERLRQFTVRARTVRLALGGGGLLCVAVLALVAGILVQGSHTVRNAQLERENQLLAAELSTIRDKVGGLESEISQLAEKDSALRILAGLDPFDQDVLQVGVGGPGLSSPEGHPLYELDQERGEQAFVITYDLNALERRARLLRESMMEASDSLAAHRDLLESTPSILPTTGRLTSGFSNARIHPIHNRALPHEGIDISAPHGTPIMAAAKGRVTFVGRRSGYGLMVELDHGYGYTTIYGHASQTLVRHGQEVDRGDVIARVGNTGLATSPHLHYEVRVGGRPVNPLNYVITGAIP